MEITAQRIKELEEAELRLRALEAAGVDNWEGYGFALDKIDKEIEKRKNIEDAFDEICEELSEGIEEPAGRGCGYGFRPKNTEKAFETFKKLVCKLMESK